MHRHPHAAAVAVLDAEVVLAHHAHAHVLEHRQAVGQHDRRPQVVDLEAQAVRIAAQRPVQRQAQRLLGRQRIDLEHVRHRSAGTVDLAVHLREGGAPAFQQRHARALAGLVDQRVAQLVVPAPRRRGQPCFDLAAVVGRHLARRRADGEVHPRQQRVAEQYAEVGALAGKGLHQDGLELLAQLGGIGLARHVHQAGDEALVGVAPQEQAQALALACRQDTQRGLVQLILADLEQVVARVGGQDVLQRLGQVPAFGQRGTVQHGRHLLAQQRDLVDARGIGGGAEQADEAVLADHLAGGVVALDADIVAVARPVHGGTGVRACHQQQRHRCARHRPGLRRHRGEAGRDLVRRLSQHAQAAAAHQAQQILALLMNQVVAAVAEQREVVLRQPLQEGPGLGSQCRRHGGRRPLQLGDGLLQPVQHGPPVAHRTTHVGQHALQTGRQFGTQRRVDQPVDFDMHPRFAWGLRVGLVRPQLVQRLQTALRVALHHQHRVHDQMQRQALAVDLHGGAVHQEGHVVVDHLDHGVARGPAMLGQRRADDAQPGGARLALGAELPGRQQRTEQVLGRARGQVVDIQVVEVGTREGLDGGTLRPFQARRSQRQHGVDALAARGLDRCVHRFVSSATPGLQLGRLRFWTPPQLTPALCHGIALRSPLAELRTPHP